MYVTYNLGDKILFRFRTVKYCSNCIHCGNLCSWKLLSSGVLAKELIKSIRDTFLREKQIRVYYGALFVCSEKCLKKLNFIHSLKGGVKIRKRVEQWLNQPPQEYFISFNYDEKSGNIQDLTENNKFIIRVVKNQEGANFVEFYKRERSYPSHKAIRFFAQDDEITSVTKNITALFSAQEQ